MIIAAVEDSSLRTSERIFEVNALKTDIVTKITEVEAKLNVLNDQSTALGEKL